MVAVYNRSTTTALSNMFWVAASAQKSVIANQIFSFDKVTFTQISNLAVLSHSRRTARLGKLEHCNISSLRTVHQDCL